MELANARGGNGCRVGLHVRQQVDPKKLELSIARTAFGISPLRLLDAQGLDTGLAALERNLQRALSEAQQLDSVARHVPSKSMLFERRGLLSREIRELELELRTYHLEKIRRRELGMATVGVQLQKERLRMSHGVRLPRLNAQMTAETGPQVTKEVPQFIQRKLPVLSPSRMQHFMSMEVDHGESVH